MPGGPFADHWRAAFERAHAAKLTAERERDEARAERDALREALYALFHIDGERWRGDRFDAFAETIRDQARDALKLGDDRARWGVKR